MIIKEKCKKCRRAGEKLFIKGEKCLSPKCVFEKKPSPPGLPLNARKHRTTLSEYGVQLKEKQKIRITYQLSEKQFANYVKKALAKHSVSPKEQLFEELEMRLDNVVYRLGFAQSRPLARQITSHGHFTVNGRRVDIPSYKVCKGDLITLRDQSKQKVLFTDISEKNQKTSVPAWLKLDSKKLEGTVQDKPALKDSDMTFNLVAIIEFYSR